MTRKGEVRKPIEGVCVLLGFRKRERIFQVTGGYVSSSKLRLNIFPAFSELF